MGLPKNYQEKVNLPNRVKALNDLTFYTFKYKLNLTEEAITKIYENLGKDILDTYEEFIGSITINKTVHIDNSGGEAFGEKKFSAIDDEKSMEKFEEWLSKAEEIGLVNDYKIVSVTKRTFKEELEQKNIMDILNYKERD